MSMGGSFEFPEPDRFTTGAVGPPGGRVFYLQAQSGDQVVTLRLEKAQVAALAQYLAELLSDLPAPEGEAKAELELAEPVVPEFVVGQLGVVFDEQRDRVLIRADELVPEGDDEATAEDRGVARFSLTRTQVAAFILHAATVVAAGRPPCPLCGRPVDNDGHMCIKTNGHRQA